MTSLTSSWIQLQPTIPLIHMKSMQQSDTLATQLLWLEQLTGTEDRTISAIIITMSDVRRRIPGQNKTGRPVSQVSYFSLDGSPSGDQCSQFPMYS